MSASTLAQLALSIPQSYQSNINYSERNAVAVVGPIRASGNLVGTLVALANLAWLQVLQGRLRAAAAALDTQ